MPPIRVRIPFLRTPSSDSTMHVPFENLKIQSPEHPPASAEGSALEPNTIKGRQRVAEGMIGRRRTVIDMQKAELSTLNSSRERYTKRLKAAKGQIAELEHRLQEDARTYKQAVAKRDQRIQTLEEELARTKELLTARTTELSGAQSFLSTADRRSEADVLGIVRDLNENIFQVAANLTEEWENLRPDKSSRFHIRNDEIDAFSQSFGPALVLHVLDRDPTAVTFLVQSCLCDFAVQVSSSWRYKRGFRTLSSLHKRLSTSGECTPHATNEMQLMHTRGTGNLIQVEVIDPQIPLQTVVRYRLDRSVSRGRPMAHRVIPVPSLFIRLCQDEGVQRVNNHRKFRNALGVGVYGGYHVL